MKLHACNYLYTVFLLVNNFFLPDKEKERHDFKQTPAPSEEEVNAGVYGNGKRWQERFLLKLSVQCNISVNVPLYEIPFDSFLYTVLLYLNMIKNLLTNDKSMVQTAQKHQYICKLTQKPNVNTPMNKLTSNCMKGAIYRK